MLRIAGLLFWSVGFVLLGGCGAHMQAALQTARLAVGTSSPPEGDALPGLERLWVRVGRQAGVVVRAESPDARVDEGLTQWYSADGALLQWREGRLVAMVDGPRHWRLTGSPSRVDWAALVRGEPLHYRAALDVQPGYHLALAHERQIVWSPGGPPGRDLPGRQAGWLWFHDRAVADLAGGPASTHRLAVRTQFWYGVDTRGAVAEVVAGQACPAHWPCLQWQRLPVTASPFDQHRASRP